MNKKKISVSLFLSVTTRTSKKTVDLFDWFFDPEVKKGVEYTRKVTAGNKEKYKAYKDCMPCITPSGIFNIRADDQLIEHSGYICLDIDGKDNPHITDMTELRAQISRIVNVALVMLSLSQDGLCCFIPIKYPEKHKEHFNSLLRIFLELGIVIDNKCGNVSRLRIATYDADAYINKDAVPFELFEDKKVSPSPKKDKEKKYHSTGTKTFVKDLNNARFHKLLNSIVEKGLDITDSYERWFGVGCALAQEFGEEGRGYYHDISQFNSEYNIHKTDYQFDKCLESTSSGKNNFSLGTIFFYAKELGVEI